MPALTIPDPNRAAPPGRADTRPMARIVEAIAAAARAGKPCPSNQALAERCGYAKASSIVGLIRKAELAGLIRVQRGQCDRVVAAADGTWRTAGTITTPHWRQRAERAA